MVGLTDIVKSVSYKKGDRHSSFVIIQIHPEIFISVRQITIVNLYIVFLIN